MVSALRFLHFSFFVRGSVVYGHNRQKAEHPQTPSSEGVFLFRRSILLTQKSEKYMGYENVDTQESVVEVASLCPNGCPSWEECDC
jgi:hypothetical protein